ncbi:MAG TPA: hypothetical protein VIV11_24975 [Kofleriaceae bacterium]
MKSAVCIVIAIVASGRLAAADDVVEDEVEDSKHVATYSMSPIHLLLPVVELQAELKAHPRIGIALIAGAGRVSDEAKTITATAYEVGGQLNFYFLQPFAGLHLGAEAVYLTVDDVMQNPTVSGQGLSIGAYVGYKVQTSVGFAFIAQGGIQYMAVEAESSTAMASDSKVGGLLNLNVGWSL